MSAIPQEEVEALLAMIVGKPDPATESRNALIGLMDQMGPIKESVEGYRAEMEAAGYSSGLARKMASDFHGYLLRLIASTL